MVASARSLSTLLTSPGKVAHALDWRKGKGSLLSLSISRDFIDVAVASHPSNKEEPQTLSSIPINTECVGTNERVLSSRVAKDLSTIIQDFNVCGVVVGWPVTKSGWCGAACGRVLFTLDHLKREDSSNSPTVCLWDEAHRIDLSAEDEWGRCPTYAEKTCNKTVHIASQEQYKAPTNTNTVAADILLDFYETNWPELYYKRQKPTSRSDPWLGKNGLTETPALLTDVDDSWRDCFEEPSSTVATGAIF